MSTTIHDSAVAEEPKARPRTARTRQNDLGGLPGGGESRIYRGASVEELIPKIQSDLGNDAIILRRRSGLTGGVGGFFQRQIVEIEACASHPHVDLYDEADVTSLPPDGLLERSPEETPGRPLRPEALAPSPDMTTAPGEFPPGAVPWPGPAPAEARRPGVSPQHRAMSEPAPDVPAGLRWPEADRAVVDGRSAGMPSQQRSFTAAQQRAYAELYGRPPEQQDVQMETPFHRPPGASDGFEPFPTAVPERPQARGIRSLLGDSMPSDDGEPPAKMAPSEPVAAREPITMRGAESFAAALAEAEAAVPGEPVEEQLLSVGVGEALVKDLVETAATVALPLMSPNASLRDAVRLVVQLMIPMGRQLPRTNVAVALVGPGGSGKSACCRELLRKGADGGVAKVACATITGDARSGGHMVTLEPHFSAPMPVADADVQGILRATRREGLLLLDTPAVSPADRRSVFSLAALLDTMSADLIMMAMPATLGAKPAAQMLRALRALGASAMAITHADETDQLGVAVQAACAFGLAPEYLLTSRTGDERLIPIDPTSLVGHLLPVS